MPCNHDSKSYQNTSHVIRLLFAVTDTNLHKTRYPVHTLRTCTYEQARCTGTVANIWFVYTSTGNLLIWTSEIRTLQHAGHIMVVPNAVFAYKLTSEIMAPPISGHLKWSRVSGLGFIVPLQPHTCTTVYSHPGTHVRRYTCIYTAYSECLNTTQTAPKEQLKRTITGSSFPPQHLLCMPCMCTALS